MSRKSSKEEKRDPWEAFVLTLLFGLIILVAGGFNIITIAIGAGLSLLGFMELPSIRLALELRINKVTGTNVFNISDSQISGSNVIGNVSGDVIIQQRGKESREPPGKRPIEREFSLETDEHKTIPLSMEKGQRLEGKVECDGVVDVFVMGKASLRTFEDGGEPYSYWLAEGIETTSIEFDNDQDRDVFFVVSNDYGEENEEEVVHVEAKLNIVDGS